jgi:hypothetical protein
MDGLAAFRYVVARSRNSVAAREESGTGDQKQSDESCHAVLLPKVPGADRDYEPGIFYRD